MTKIDQPHHSLPRPVRVTIVSRIFEPEPSAASFRLGVLAETLSQKGHHVSVLTVQPPKPLAASNVDKQRNYRVSRMPVLRDRTGYVRGYFPYLSFDVPLFFRLLFGRKTDVIIVEPPPTTGLSVRFASLLRRTPYVYYAADIWGDGATQTGAPSWVIRAVRRMESIAMTGAKTVLSVSNSLTQRLAELGINQSVLTVGNGVDARAFFLSSRPSLDQELRQHPEFIYAGTASEWHGASVFIQALPRVLALVPDVRLRFIGGGSEIGSFLKQAADLGVSHAVKIEPYMPPSELAPILRGAVAAVASIRPGNGNEFTFPTKLYSAVLCGTPSVFAGVGPARDFLSTKIDGRPLGVSTDMDPEAVAEAMLNAIDRTDSAAHRLLVSAWGQEHVSLSGVANRVIDEIVRITRTPASR